MYLIGMDLKSKGDEIMAIQWHWDEKIGTMDMFNYDEVKTYSLYQGNAFLVIIYEFTDDDGKDKYQIKGFFADKEHAKNCLGLNKSQGFDENMYNDEYQQIRKIRINKAKYKYTKDLVDMLIKAFDNISIEIYSE